MKKISDRHGYEILAFITGAALMVFELVAARVLAPTIGSSTFVWTSVIGVIIAALSLGYFAGGRLADQRNRRSDLPWLLLVVALCMAFTIVMYPWFLDWLASGELDTRLQGVVASLVLFAPTSFVLGAVSPYLAKLNVTSLATSGNAIASLSALNSIGGIVGTFLTGFVLFGLIGSHQILLALLVVMVCMSWFVMPRASWRLRLAASALAISLGGLSLAGDTGSIQIDTASTHYEVQQYASEGGDYRLLATGPHGYQSGIDMNRPDELLFWYTRELAEQIKEAEHKDRMLFLGGGAFVLPEYIAKQYPDSQIDVVEIDPGLVAIAEKHFGFEHQPNLTIIASDARTVVNQTKERYDIAVVDVYGDSDIPFSFMTAEYGARLAEVVAPGGSVLVNAIAGGAGACKALGQAIAAPYQAQFRYGSRVVEPEGDRTVAANMILNFSNQSSQLDEARVLWPQVAPVTDNYAPIEQLQLACRTSR